MILTDVENKPSPAKVGSNKLRVQNGFDQIGISQTQLRGDNASCFYSDQNPYSKFRLFILILGAKNIYVL